MIDLEVTRRCSPLLDVVQLLDDYPVFHANVTGWQARVSLAERHWKQVIETDFAVGLVEFGVHCIADISVCVWRSVLRQCSFEM